MKTFVKNILAPRIRTKPDFLIVGAQKSGTTSLYRYLSEHPSILPNKSWKEVHYYNNVDNYRKGIGWYLNHFPIKYKNKNKLTFEATPNYLYFPEIPERIYRDLGNIKIIAVLRNPAERAYSAWHMYHSFKDNPEESLQLLYDSRTFDQAIDDELFSGSYPSNHPYHYIDRGKYVYQIDRYYKTFPEKNVLVLNFEDLKNNLGLLLDKICDFLRIGRFQDASEANIKGRQYNVGTYERTALADNKIMELQKYFAPYNQKLFERIGEIYPWPS